MSAVTNLAGGALAPAADRRLRHAEPARQNRRSPLLEAAIEPARHQFDPAALDVLAKALALTPPQPRRGVMLLDPSYEVKAEYDTIPKAVIAVARKWNVGIIALWYPLLVAGSHAPMLRGLQDAFPDALRHEVRFPPVRDGHRMIGSGMFVINPPWGLAEEAARLALRAVESDAPLAPETILLEPRLVVRASTGR